MRVPRSRPQKIQLRVLPRGSETVGRTFSDRDSSTVLLIALVTLSIFMLVVFLLI